MSSGLNADLAIAFQELDAARGELLDAINVLADDALDRARRGGWSVRRVLQHIIEGEWSHVRLVTQLRGLPATPPTAAGDTAASVPQAVRQLTDARQALLATLDGIDEESFYRLGTIGRQEYSVLSVLENAAHHDREHAQQIRSIVATA